MYQHLRKLAKKETGASAVEYALLVVAIALIMVVGAFLLGKAINSRMTSSADCVNNVTVNNNSAC